MDDAEPGYFPAIDGLRALAVCSVLLFHAGHLQGGFLGVDTFFVISGFLITGILLREIDRSQTVRLGEFWARRARRLLPALVLMMCVITMWSLYFGTAAERLALRADTLWGLSFLMNWHEIAARHDYWAAFALQSPLTHLWSLAVEEQFYLVWPLVALAVASWALRPQRTMAIICATGAALSFALMAALYDPTVSTRVYEGTDSRVGAMMIGGLFATRPARELTRRVLNKSSRVAQGAIGASALALSAAIVWMYARADGSASVMFYGGFLVFASAVGLVLTAVTTIPSTSSALRRSPIAAVRTVLSLRVLRSIGRLSYGLYLWHWPIFLMLSPLRTGLSEWPLLALRLSVTWVVAVASYYVVERPARLGLQRLPRWMTAPAAAFAIAAAAIVAVSVASPQAGVAALDVSLIDNAALAAGTSAQSTPPDAQNARADLDARAHPWFSVDSPYGLADRSRDTSVTAHVAAPVAPLKRGEIHTMVVFGDSIAETTEPGLVAAFSPAGVTVVRGAFPGVGLVNIAGYGEFAHIYDLIDQAHPEVVVVQLSPWDAKFGEDRQFTALTLLHQIVQGAHAQLVILPVPPLRADQAVAGLSDLSAAGRHAASTWPEDVSFLDAAALWGPTYNVDLNGDGVPERMYDGVHLCPSGAALVGAWLVTQFNILFDGVTPAPVASWANGAWVNAPEYNNPPGACASQ